MSHASANDKPRPQMQDEKRIAEELRALRELWDQILSGLAWAG